MDFGEKTSNPKLKLYGEIDLNSNPTFSGMSTPKSNGMHEYEPMNGMQGDKEHDNSVHINIHLVEETENNRGGRKKEAPKFLIVLIISQIVRYIY